ncbi:MAG TPA: hypothetical protein VEC97_04480 [Candidatus Acidoferrales bacterium]|nr:hypothetical protein [Candidatus Acidoferrales bacterium]
MSKRLEADSEIDMEPSPLPQPRPLRPFPTPLPHISVRSTAKSSFHIFLREDWN